MPSSFCLELWGAGLLFFLFNILLCSDSAARLHVGVLSPEHRLPVATVPKKNDSSSSSCHQLSVAFHLGRGLSHGLS